MALTQSLARQIVEVLGSAGTPPVKGVQYFNAGNHSLLDALDQFYLSSYLQDGGATYKMVVGDYGSGKSHFLYCLRDLAWERGFAVSKVDLSPVETPYNDQRAVYAAVARNLIWHEADESASDEYGLTRFLEGTLQRVVGGPLSLETAGHANYRGLVDTLELATIDSLAFKNAVLAYFEALIRDQEERLDSLTRWLMGTATTPADTRDPARGRRQRQDHPPQRLSHVALAGPDRARAFLQRADPALRRGGPHGQHRRQG